MEDPNLTWHDYKSYLAEVNVYENHRKRTEKRYDRLGNKIEFRLSFLEWCAIWAQSGHAQQRGIRKGQYCMSRVDDLGHYEVGNVFIQLASENFREAALRGHSKNKGRRMPETTKEKLRVAISDARKSANWSTKADPKTDGRRRENKLAKLVARAESPERD